MKKSEDRTELERALSRPDVEYLKRCLNIYREWSDRNDGNVDEWPEELDVWFNDDDADRDLALVILAASTFDDAAFLGLVAAGKLEDILCRGSTDKNLRLQDSLIDRIILEARRVPRFRWMLSGVWTISMRKDQADMIADAVGTMNCDIDPLPPRPWA